MKRWRWIPSMKLLIELALSLAMATELQRLTQFNLRRVFTVGKLSMMSSDCTDSLLSPVSIPNTFQGTFLLPIFQLLCNLWARKSNAPSSLARKTRLSTSPLTFALLSYPTCLFQFFINCSKQSSFSDLQENWCLRHSGSSCPIVIALSWEIRVESVVSCSSIPLPFCSGKCFNALSRHHVP